MSSSFVIRHSSFCFLRVLAQETLPVLLILYPLLLLLDDLEPGFVRSVVNPHWFLVALVVVGVVSGRSSHAPPPALSQNEGEGQTPPLPPPLTEGEKVGVRRFAFAVIAAIVGGLWVWWRLRSAGTLGVVVGLLAAVAVGGAVTSLNHQSPKNQTPMK